MSPPPSVDVPLVLLTLLPGDAEVFFVVVIFTYASPCVSAGTFAFSVRVTTGGKAACNAVSTEKILLFILFTPKCF